MYVTSKQRLFINPQHEMHTTVTVRSNQIYQTQDRHCGLCGNEKENNCTVASHDATVRVFSHSALT